MNGEHLASVNCPLCGAETEVVGNDPSAPMVAPHRFHETNMRTTLGLPRGLVSSPSTVTLRNGVTATFQCPMSRMPVG